MEKSAKETLKSFSIIYIILAVYSVLLAIICNVVPDIANMFKNGFAHNVMIDIIAGTVVNVIIYIWYFWLTRRVADGKSNGTLLMILLILGVVGSIVSFFTTTSLATLLTLDFIVDMIALCYVIRARKEN